MLIIRLYNFCLNNCVDIVFDALIISFNLGTPNVTFIDATPAKWNVFNVICVPGSDNDCASTVSTASSGCINDSLYFNNAFFIIISNWHCVNLIVFSLNNKCISLWFNL